MNARRSCIVATTALAALALVGCAGASGAGRSDEPPNSPRPTEDLASFDPCRAFNQKQEASTGFQLVGRAQYGAQAECTFQSANMVLTFRPEPHESLDAYKKRDSDGFGPTETIGGDAVTQSPHGAGTDCATAMATGGGVMVMYAKRTDPHPASDSCNDSMRIAQLIAANLPQ